MRTALFHNFTNEPFTGYWDGKPRTFKAGESKYMPEYLARHFAKHLTNRELIRLGKETSTSPKFPEQVPDFMEIFNKACIIEQEEEQDALDVEIESKNRKEISVNVDEPKAPKQKGEPQVIIPPDADMDDEDAIDGLNNNDNK